jgi:hypothetical protein
MIEFEALKYDKAQLRQTWDEGEGGSVNKRSNEAKEEAKM